MQGVTLRRNGVSVPALLGGHRPEVVFIEGRWVEMTDVADYGYYVYPATVLAPDADGRQPTITIEITDLKHPGKPTSTTLDSFLEAKAWNDLAGYYAVTHAEYAFCAYRFREDCTSAGLGGSVAQKTCTTVVDQAASR